MGKEKFSKEIVEAALEMYRAGDDVLDIANKFSTSVQLVGYWAKKAGIKRAGQRATSAETKATAVALYVAGESSRAVADRFGVSDKIVRIWAEKAGAEVRDTREKYTEAQREEVRRLRRIGISIEDIEKRTGVANGSCRAILAEAGIVLTKEQFVENLPRVSTSEIDAKIVELRRSGIGREDIAAAVEQRLSYVKTILVQERILLDPEVAQKNAQLGKGAYYEGIKNDFFDLLKSEDYTLVSEYLNTKTPVRVRCSFDHEFVMKPCRMFNNDNRCPNCFRDSITGPSSPRSVQMLKRRGFATHLEWYQDMARKNSGRCLATENTVSHIPVGWECIKGHTWWTKPNAIHNGHWCPSCANRGPSKGQLEINDYVLSLGLETELSDRSIVTPKEIDVYIPACRLAIEYNGLYWHSAAHIVQREGIKEIIQSGTWPESYKTGKDMDKALRCHAKGIGFLMIYEDEWESKQDLIKSMIRWRCNKFSGTQLHARKLAIKRLDHNKQWEEFFDRNHLDGSAVASFGYGLFLEDKLVMCATVRKSIGSEFELARLATDYDYSVSGGASRLVRAILEEIQTPLISFSNNRLSSGDVYSKMGAQEITETFAPSYYYTDAISRIWRFKCRRINDPEILARYPNVPHTEISQALGGVFSEKLFGDNRPLYRIDDCGHKKWRIHQK